MTALETRAGNWMQTTRGRFWPLDPRPAEVHIEDIAHALSMQCRYGGHTTRFYSVAEHSVYVSRSCSPANALWGLLHDASEAYIQDVIRPVKPFLSNYKDIEHGVMRAVCERFGLPLEQPAEVSEYDTRILGNEYAQVMPPCEIPWGERYTAIPGLIIHGWSPTEAAAMFLQTFNVLYRGA